MHYDKIKNRSIENDIIIEMKEKSHYIVDPFPDINISEILSETLMT